MSSKWLNSLHPNIFHTPIIINLTNLPSCPSWIYITGFVGRSCRAAAARSGIAKAGRRKLTAIATKHAPRMGARLVEDILAAPPGHEPPS